MCPLLYLWNTKLQDSVITFKFGNETPLHYHHQHMGLGLWPGISAMSSWARDRSGATVPRQPWQPRNAREPNEIKWLSRGQSLRHQNKNTHRALTRSRQSPQWEPLPLSLATVRQAAPTWQMRGQPLRVLHLRPSRASGGSSGLTPEPTLLITVSGDLTPHLWIVWTATREEPRWQGHTGARRGSPGALPRPIWLLSPSPAPDTKTHVVIN